MIKFRLWEVQRRQDDQPLLPFGGDATVKKRIIAGLYEYKGYYIRRDRVKSLKGWGQRGHTVQHNLAWSVYQLYDAQAREDGFPEYLFHQVGDEHGTLEEAMAFIDTLPPNPKQSN